MPQHSDTLLQDFIEDCRELLEDSENLLRNVGCDDGRRPPSVRGFRLAQYAKAGADLFGLAAVKALAQSLENALGRTLVGGPLPSTEAQETLRRGFSRLDVLLDDCAAGRRGADGGAEITALARLAGANDAAPARLAVDEAEALEVDASSLAQARAVGDDIDLLTYDPHAEGGEPPLRLLRSLVRAGRVLRYAPSDAPNEPIRILYATLLNASCIGRFTHLPPERIRSVEAAATRPAGAQAGTAGMWHAFGPVALRIADGQGTIPVPMDVGPATLTGLKQALVVAMSRCAGVTLLLDGVGECDLFFCQMLCCACHAFAARGKGLRTASALSTERRSFCRAQGFGRQNNPRCLFVDRA